MCSPSVTTAPFLTEKVLVRACDRHIDEVPGQWPGKSAWRIGMRVSSTVVVLTSLWTSTVFAQPKDAPKTPTPTPTPAPAPTPQPGPTGDPAPTGGEVAPDQMPTPV